MKSEVTDFVQETNDRDDGGLTAKENESLQAACNSFRKFYAVIQTLRSKDGCPWDNAQTPLSMRKNIIEESFEAIDAVTEQNNEHACEEFGDMLLNTLLVSYVYEQQNAFTVARMIDTICEKMIRRHPHVFTAQKGECPSKDKPTERSVVTQWDKIKESVEGRRQDSALDGIPASYPPLLRADKMLSRAEKEGFVWGTEEDAVAKVREELREVEEAFADCPDAYKNGVREGAKSFTRNCGCSDEACLAHLEEETGDLLLAVVSLSRAHGIDAVSALERANEKFKKRFTFVESKMKHHAIALTKENAASMEAFWKEAKSLEK